MKSTSHSSRARTIVTVVAVLTAYWVAPGTAAAQSDERETNRSPRPPNIVLIMADDVGVEAFSTYGGTSHKTSVIDELARTGVQFNNCHAQPL